MTGSLHHIELYVSDLERSVEFWEWFLKKLGYAPYQEWGEGKSWKLGDMYIVFVQTEGKYLDASYHRKRVGLNHLAFHIDTIEALNELIKALRQRGVPVLYEEKRLAQNVAYFEDPDRIKVELVA